MAFSVNITPADDGWAVESGGIEAPMFFRSGAQAEAAGRRLAERLARSGQGAELVIVIRDGSIAGRIAFHPWAQSEV